MFRKTKMVCTIGPTSCSRENLFRLADAVRAARPLLLPDGLCRHDRTTNG